MKQLTASDLDLLRGFESCALTPAQLPHRAHLRLAFIHLSLYPFDVALATLRMRLQRFLAHHGAPRSAYHETLTHAWLLAVRHFMHSTAPAMSSEEFLLRCPKLLDKKIMATHYTSDVLLSPAARSAFVEPDREPIPRPRGRSEVTSEEDFHPESERGISKHLRDRRAGMAGRSNRGKNRCWSAFRELIARLSNAPDR